MYANNVVVGQPVLEAGIGVEAVAGHREPRVERQFSERFLKTLGMPAGINAEFVKSARDFPLRIWVVDNSGSMMTTDGKRIVRGPGGREGVVDASRWEELGDSLIWHATLAANLGAPTEFRLLNPPNSGTPQVLSVGMGDKEAEVSAVRKLITSGPTGRTPLCAQIRAVTARVKAQEATLRANGQRVVVVIASDGAATDGNIEEAMRPLQALPVWIVVRLCTDDDSVVKYWNRVDEDLELDMDVLDDLSGEGAEVTENNPWLTYGAPLHRLREWGSINKVFDVIDEKLLAVPEMLSLLSLILGPAAAEMPNPQLDWPGFEKRLEELLALEPQIWDPLRKRSRPWFALDKLRRHYSNSGGYCSIM